MITAPRSLEHINTREVKFSDNSVLTSAKNFTSEVRFTKRARFDNDVSISGSATVENVTVLNTATVEGDINITGNVPYVDNQTGWGLPQWTFAGTTYSKTADSLIIKIYTLEQLINDSLVTQDELVAATTLNNGLVYSSPGTYPLLSGNGYYSKGVTHPATDTYFIIRDSPSYQQHFQIQKGALEVGKYLRCADDQGTVEWADIIVPAAPQISGIETSNGTSTSSAFYIIDDIGTDRGMYFYPSYSAAAGLNAKSLTNDITMLFGQGNISSGNTAWNAFIGVMRGNQGIRFVADTDSLNGSTSIYGGDTNHLVQMNKDRILLQPAATKDVVVNCRASGTISSSFQVGGNDWPSENIEPLVEFGKQTTGGAAQKLWFNPLNPVNSTWNGLVTAEDATIMWGNRTVVGGVTSTKSKYNSLLLAPWSDYFDGIGIRPSIIEEEGGTSGGITYPQSSVLSGFIRLTAATTGAGSYVVNSKTYKNINDYLIVDRDGIKLKTTGTKSSTIYGKFRVLNKTGALLNDQSSTIINSSVEIGSVASNVPTVLNGSTTYSYTGMSDPTGMALVADNASGLLRYKSFQSQFPNNISNSVTFQNTVTFQEKIKYLKNLPTMNSSKLYCLGNDGTNGDIKWVEITIPESGVVEKPIQFQDDITLYNQMFFVDLDLGLATAAAVGGFAYAVGQGSVSNQKKFGQYWSSNNNALSFYWRYNDSLANPPYKYSFLIHDQGVQSKFIRVGNAHPPASDYTTPNDLQFFLNNRVVTDSTATTINNTTYVVPRTAPANLCVAGYYNYRMPAEGQPDNMYMGPGAGDILINWGGTINYIDQMEQYGRFKVVNFADAIPRSFEWDQYFEGDVYVGSSIDYSRNFFGTTRNYAKNVSKLTIFGKLFYKYAADATGTGSSPLNSYLGCVNASTGEIGFLTPTFTLPTNATFNSITVGSLYGDFITSLQATFGNSSIESVTINNTTQISGDLYVNVTGADAGKVLVCTNTQGKAAWADPQQVAIPSNVTFTNATVTGVLDVPGLSRINTFDMLYLMKDVDHSAAITHTIYYNQVVETLKCSVLGQYDPSIQNFNRGTIYYITPQTTTLVGRITIPANQTARVQINIPLAIDHHWSFRGDCSGDNNGVFLRYFVERITVNMYLTSSGALSYSYVYNNTVAHSTSDLGFCELFYNRGTGSPTNDLWEFSNTVLLSNAPIQFTPDRYPDTRTYDIRVHFDISFSYETQGGDENLIASHWGTDTPSHYFTDFQFLMIPNNDDMTLHTQGFRAYQIDHGSGLQQYTIWNSRYSSKTWNRTEFTYQPYFNWGTTINPLPWGVINYHSKEQIGYAKKLLASTGQFGTVHVSNHITSLGFVSCRGLWGRPGYGREESHANLSYGYTPNTKSVEMSSSIINHHWTGDKFNSWVDATKILSQSPNVSDYRVKRNLSSIPYVLDSICSTPIYQYDVDHEVFHAERKIGVIAHELAENFPTIPHLVQGTKDAVDSTGHVIAQMVDYQELTIILMKGIQELKAEVDELKQIIRNLSF